MPNYVCNILYVPTEKDKIFNLLKNKNYIVDFNKVIPIDYSKKFTREEKKDIKKFGYGTVFWGTKCNALDSLYVGDDIIIFETAWESPEKIWREINNKFPKIQFIVFYADPDIGRNCGVCNCFEKIEHIKKDGDNIYAKKIVDAVQNRKSYDHLMKKIINPTMLENNIRKSNNLQTNKIPHNFNNKKLSNKKLSNKKLSNKNLSNNNLSNKKLSNKKLSNKKLSNKKLSNRK